MSATGPYKSKLFNFLNRQSIQWGNRLTQAARRLKITVEWGSQIALYPLYLLVQSSRVATRQFAAYQAQRRAIAAESTPAVNITDLTTEIFALSAPEATDQELRGIACNLAGREIVFVDAQNQTILPDQSQAALQKQISLQLGDRNYQKRQQAQAAFSPSQPRLLPPVQTNRPQLLPPVRWILQGLSWLEHSPVAIAIDLFGESSWHTAVIPPEIYNPQLLPPIPFAPLLQPIDQRVAQLEQQLFSPDPSVELPPLQRFFQTFLQTLFKSEFKSNQSPETPKENPPTTPNSWLTWTDLFKEKLTLSRSPEIATAPTSPITPAQLNALNRPSAIAIPTPPSPTDLVAQNTFTNEQRAIAVSTPPSPTDLVAHKTVIKDLAAIGKEEPQTGIEVKPAWIETEALSVGYEQHFLERILKAVDHVMAWLENTFTKILSKVRF